MVKKYVGKGVCCHVWDQEIDSVYTNNGGSRIFQTGGRGANFQGGGENLLFGQIFPKKLHENERIWTPEAGACDTSEGIQPWADVTSGPKQTPPPPSPMKRTEFYKKLGVYWH